jgi:hypothetical protein
MFTSRYELSRNIKQTRFFFKGLIDQCTVVGHLKLEISLLLNF